MRQVRQGVFETNSSSCHSITMCSEEEFNALKAGTLLIHEWDDILKSPDEIDVFSEEEIKEYYNKTKEMFWKDYELLSNEEKEEVRKRYEDKHSEKRYYKTYREYMDKHSYNFETFLDSYTTQNGDKVVAFGYYGYDG
jgi:hypothetical protein